MDIDWSTSDALPPHIIYRVVTSGQWTQIHPEVGLVSLKRLFSNILPHYSAASTSQPLDFLHSIRDHRQQRPKATNYIAFFEAKNEAVAWCIAAQSLYGGDVETRIMMVETSVLDELERKWFRVADVVGGCRKMGWEDPETELGLAKGERTSEVLVCGYVPWEAIVGGKERWVDKSVEQQPEPAKQASSSRLGISQMLAPPAQQIIKTVKDYLDEPKFETYPEIGSCGCSLGQECEHLNWSICVRLDEEFQYREKQRIAKEKKAKGAKELRERKKHEQKVNENLKAELLRKEWTATGKPSQDALLG